MGATAAALCLGAAGLVVYVLAAIAATSITLTRPAQNGLLPALATSPEALTAANAALGTIENASILVAPALAGALLSLAGPGFVFASVAVWLALSALLIGGLPAPPATVHPRADAAGVAQAIRILAADRRALLLVTLL